MQDLDTSKIKKTLSIERFESYRRTIEQLDEQVLACYLRNIQLSEALYPTFAILEVTLRNQLHHALCQKMQTQSWYEYHPDVLSPTEQAEIQKAKDYLCQHGKPIESGRIIAELNFGFWTRLFHPYYEKKLWPSLILDVFPYAPRWSRERKKLLKRLNSFRLLRNRVSHHEPIWDWPNLPTIHQDMIETVGWMCPSTKQALAFIDRFSVVFESPKK
jgi:hypothetical protein